MPIAKVTPRILLVDDEESFREATAELLREADYICETAEDAHVAEELLRNSEYDVVVADILMPGNARLEFLRAVHQLNRGTSILLVTGRPSLETALDALHLGVVAYLVKPFDWDEFLRHVSEGINATRARRVLHQAHQRLGDQIRELERLDAASSSETNPGFRPPLASYLEIALSSIATSLSDLLRVASAAQDTSLGSLKLDRPVCHLFHCPRRLTLEAAVTEAVEVLEQTKQSFRSRDLSELRHKLEAVLKTS